MGVKLTRHKPRVFLLSFIYKLQKLLPMSKKAKMKFFLNMEWIFDRLSHEMSFKIYEPDLHPVRQKSKEFILAHLSSQSKVLDLGCHTGDISFILAQKALHVTGIDFNASAIQEAQAKYKKDNLVFMSREALEFLQSGQHDFDTLVLSHILEHLDEPKQFLMEFKKYFKKIYIELPDFDKYYLNHYRQQLNVRLIYTDNDHVSEFDRDELNAILTACGIEIEVAEYRYGLQKLWCRVL